MNFFITSVGAGDGANLGGLLGADRHCQTLAAVAGSSKRIWRAYLSTSETPQAAAIHARNRIGTGPWYNAKGVRVAGNVDELHGDKNSLNKQNSLTEKGDMVNGRGDTPNRHDILTGSQARWHVAERRRRHDLPELDQQRHGQRPGRASRPPGRRRNPTSWNSAHASKGCSQQNLQATGVMRCSIVSPPTEHAPPSGVERAGRGDTAVRGLRRIR